MALLAGAMVAVLAGLGAWFVLHRPPPPPPPAATAPVRPAAPAGPLHPVPQAAGDRPLPALDASDPSMRESLVALAGVQAVERFLMVDGVVRRIVATIDNLPREEYAARLNPVKPIPGAVVTSGRDDTLVLAPANAARYAPFLAMMDAVDAAAVAELYLRDYPLFQQAYVELGYPGGHFNDRLVEVIDHLQATPQVEGPLAMTLTEVKGPYPSTTPWLRYEFADPALQSLSAGQRALLRSGAVNQRRLLAWLAAFRVQIVR